MDGSLSRGVTLRYMSSRINILTFSLMVALMCSRFEADWWDKTESACNRVVGRPRYGRGNYLHAA